MIALIPAGLSKLLLIMHAVGAGVLFGSSTHSALQSVAQLRGRANPRLLRLYPAVALSAWSVTFVLGAVLYPRYRVFVRNDVFDRHAVWASILFDCKENAALLAGILFLSAFLQRKTLLLTPVQRRIHLALTLSSAVLIWFVSLSGLLITSVKGV